MFQRLRITPKQHTAFLLAVVSISFFLYAYSSGITGMTQLNGAGCTCHGDLSAGVTVSIEGPDTLSPGQVASYTVSISGGPLTRGGTNIAVTGGSLATLLGSGLQKIGNELTHTSPKQPVSGAVTFAFNYTAPNTTGNVTMHANGNSVNFNGGNDGDQWNFAPSKTITVANIVPVELTSFTASVSDGEVALTWSTATEMNNKGFEVERAEVTGGVKQEFTSLTFIQGSGTTTEQRVYNYTDRPGKAGVYQYRIKQTDFDGSFTYYNLSAETEVTMPELFTLEQNYPNPFNPSTQIRFSLASESFVTMKIYSITGQEVATLLQKQMEKGSHSISFTPDDYGLTSGVYIYTLDAGDYKAARKMALTK
ncbi:MAG: hypothetical protein FMNOHCHN_03335 [Ignavibacteriaceae bacterium]|nr:hypothetical protein [Ignavibacteriaceae bacterium]